MVRRFLTGSKPLLVTMVQAYTPERVKELIDLSRPEGAEAFGLQFCRMKEEYKTEENIRELFRYASPLPTYVTNYRQGENVHKSDETLASELLTFAECGATLCDVMGDYFDACDGELTMNSEAIQKQTELIDALHRRSAQVVMSSHICKFTPADEILHVAREHQRRGADICKIVTGADSMEEQIENLRILELLRNTLDIPFLFISVGECRLIRRVGASMGSCMSLCVYEHDELSTPAQPLLRDMKILHKLLGEK